MIPRPALAGRFRDIRRRATDVAFPAVLELSMLFTAVAVVAVLAFSVSLMSESIAR